MIIVHLPQKILTVWRKSNDKQTNKQKIGYYTAVNARILFWGARIQLVPL